MSADQEITFTLQDAALAYAHCAEELMRSFRFLPKEYQATVPVFVHLLFQSLEISIKYLAYELNLFTEEESRAPEMGKGHDVRKLTQFAQDRLKEKLRGEDKPFGLSFLECMAFFTDKPKYSLEILITMLQEETFARTRNLYRDRDLAYAQIRNNEIALIASDLIGWVSVTKQIAKELHKPFNLIADLRRLGRDLGDSSLTQTLRMPFDLG